MYNDYVLQQKKSRQKYKLTSETLFQESIEITESRMELKFS